MVHTAAKNILGSPLAQIKSHCSNNWYFLYGQTSHFSLFSNSPLQIICADTRIYHRQRHVRVSTVCLCKWRNPAQLHCEGDLMVLWCGIFLTETTVLFWKDPNEPERSPSKPTRSLEKLTNWRTCVPLQSHAWRTWKGFGLDSFLLRSRGVKVKYNPCTDSCLSSPYMHITPYL